MKSIALQIFTKGGKGGDYNRLPPERLKTLEKAGDWNRLATEKIKWVKEGLPPKTIWGMAHLGPELPEHYYH